MVTLLVLLLFLLMSSSEAIIQTEPAEPIEIELTGNQCIKQQQESLPNVSTSEMEGNILSTSESVESGVILEQITYLLEMEQLTMARLARKRLIIYALMVCLLMLFTAFIILHIRYQKIKQMIAMQPLSFDPCIENAQELQDNQGYLSTIAITEEGREHLLLKLESLMKSDKFFKRKQLTMQELAGELGTNTTYLSRIIHENFLCSFSETINNNRIEEAKKLMMQKFHKKNTLAGIADSVGFHSRSAFNIAFKKTTGICPSQYIKLIESGITETGG